MSELAALDATAQAALVRRAEASPVELVEAAIERIERIDDVTHAVVLPRFDAARAEAKEATDLAPSATGSTGPFHGVPFLTKDLGCTTAGEPQTDGMRVLREAGWVAAETAHLARRFRAAGFVNLGRTSAPELGLTPTTEPVAWGPTHNPWDPTRSPGGSSGGSAAAVAAGLVPVAHASDGGGSIRIPASACGLFGLKPSRGVVSVGPVTAPLTNPFSVQFVLTRSVRDAAALLDVCAGPEPGDPFGAPRAPLAYRDAIVHDPPSLRIGVMTTAPGGATTVDDECVRAADEAARLLESLGHRVEVAHPAAFDDPTRGEVFGRLWSVGSAAQVDAWSTALGRPITADDVEPATWVMVEAGRRRTAVEHLDALRTMQSWSNAMAAWWRRPDEPDGGPASSEQRPQERHGGFDLLLTPTLAEPPAPLGTFADAEQPYAGLVRAGAYTPFTPAFNMTGQPAVSLPLHLSDEGLPIGVQLVAGYGRDALLLAVGRQLERAAPWGDRRPHVHA